MARTGELSQSDRMERNALKAVYCHNRKCKNTRPIGRAMLGPGSAVSFECRNCGTKTVVFGKVAPHWA